jgi:hypothetical protein
MIFLNGKYVSKINLHRYKQCIVCSEYIVNRKGNAIMCLKCADLKRRRIQSKLMLRYRKKQKIKEAEKMLYFKENNQGYFIPQHCHLCKSTKNVTTAMWGKEIFLGYIRTGLYCEKCKNKIITSWNRVKNKNYTRARLMKIIAKFREKNFNKANKVTERKYRTKVKSCI